MFITYGVDQNIIDVTQHVLQHYFDGNVLFIKRGIDFNSFGGDPCVGKVKTLTIQYFHNGTSVEKVYAERYPHNIKIHYGSQVNEDLTEFIKSKIAVIYVYYERINEQKNQTNLSYFIKHGMNKDLWHELDITYLFVINGHQCEVIIPSYPHVHVLKEDNCSDWEGWGNGITYLEGKLGKPIWQSFDYLCLINAGTIGPIKESDMQDHWLFPFYKKLKVHNATICSPCISFFNQNHQTGPGARVVPIFTLIKIDQQVIQLLTRTQVSNTNEKSKFHGSVYHNTVLGRKASKEDAVLTGEYGLSKILMDNGYRITSLLYDDDVDVNDPANWGINSFTEPDRYRSFNGIFLPLSTIFIKNVWRIMSGNLITYASLPVLYDECMRFVYEKMKMQNIFRNRHVSYNYDLLAIDKYKINCSREEYYQKWLRAEEMILYVKPHAEIKSCLIYAHYDKDNIIKDYVIQAINTFVYLGYDVMFFTASSELKNASILPCKTFFVKNEDYGTDWKIWMRACKHISMSGIGYDWIMFMNDSLLLPINGIDNMKNTIAEMRQTCDFWGHWDSPECSPHIIGALIEFKFKMLDDVIAFMEKTIVRCTTKQDYILILEVNFSNFLSSKKYVSNVVIDEKLLHRKEGRVCPIFNPYIIRQWINNPRTFAIKWKYCLAYLESDIVSPEFRFLARFLHFGSHGFKSDAEESGVFPSSLTFNPN